MGWIGVALVLLAFALFVADLSVTNHGLPAAGGVAALALGISTFLVATPGYLLLPLTTFVLVAILAAVLVAAASVKALAQREGLTKTGAEGMIGEVGAVRAPVGAGTPGWVFVHGELWRAVVAVAPEDAYEEEERERVLGIGRKVQVVGMGDGKVVVLPFEESATPEYLVRGPG